MEKFRLELLVSAALLSVLSPVAASAGPSAVSVTARAEIIEPDNVIALRAAEMQSGGRATVTGGKLAASRSISKRQARVDVEGRIVEGRPNVQLITVDVH